MAVKRVTKLNDLYVVFSVLSYLYGIYVSSRESDPRERFEIKVIVQLSEWELNREKKIIGMQRRQDEENMQRQNIDRWQGRETEIHFQ